MKGSRTQPTIGMPGSATAIAPPRAMAEMATSTPLGMVVCKGLSMQGLRAETSPGDADRQKERSQCSDRRVTLTSGATAAPRTT